MNPTEVRRLLKRRIALLCVARDHELYERQHEEERRAEEREAYAIEDLLEKSGYTDDIPIRQDVTLPDDWMDIAERFRASERRSHRNMMRRFRA